MCNKQSNLISKRAVVSHKAAKKQHAHLQAYVTTIVSYLHGWQLLNFKML